MYVEIYKKKERGFEQNRIHDDVLFSVRGIGKEKIQSCEGGEKGEEG